MNPLADSRRHDSLPIRYPWESRLGKLRRQMIGGSARIAIQKAVVETLAANGEDVRLAEGLLSNLVEIQRIFEERYRDAQMVWLRPDR